MMQRGYVLDNRHDAAAAHHQALQELLDAETRQRIMALPCWVKVQRCLEVGAGAGSVATWLAEEVSPTGHVVATDLKPDLLPRHPRLVPVGHDLADPAPWPSSMDGPFDLVVARLVLAHLPERDQIMARLVDRLGPGGAILVQSWIPVPWQEWALAAADDHSAELLCRYQRSFNAILEDAGGSYLWARHLHLRLKSYGLAVDTAISGGYWTGGGPGMRLVRAVAAQLRPRLLALGWTAAELEQLDEVTEDRRTIVHGHLLYSVSATAHVT